MSKTTLRLGVISDTHGLLRPEAVAALRGSDLRRPPPLPPADHAGARRGEGDGADAGDRGAYAGTVGWVSLRSTILQEASRDHGSPNALSAGTFAMMPASLPVSPGGISS